MSILVTGGLGFIGSNLVDLLISMNYKVAVIDNLSTGLKANKNSKAKYIYQDIRNYINSPQKLRSIIKTNKIKIIFHLAASADVRLSMKCPEEVFDINVISSVALFNIVNNCGIKKFIFTSTSAVYGEPKYFPVDEKHKKEPISTYGLSKLTFEQYLSYSAKENVSTIIFRLPNVYGPRQRPDLEAGVIAIFNNLMKKGKKVNIYGDGLQSRDWVHVDDIINAFILSIKKKLKYEIIGLGSRKKHNVNYLYRNLAIINRYSLKPKFLKSRPGDITNMIMCNKKAKKLLNWSPSIDFKNGLKKIED